MTAFAIVLAAFVGLLVGSWLTKRLYFTQVEIRTIPVVMPCEVCEEKDREFNFSLNPPPSIVDPVATSFENPFEEGALSVNPS